MKLRADIYWKLLARARASCEQSVLLGRGFRALNLHQKIIKITNETRYSEWFNLDYFRLITFSNCSSTRSSGFQRAT